MTQTRSVMLRTDSAVNPARSWRRLRSDRGLTRIVHELGEGLVVGEVGARPRRKVVARPHIPTRETRGTRRQRPWPS